MAEPLAVNPSATNPDYTRLHIYEVEVFPNTRVSPNMVYSPLLMFVWQMRSRSVTREGSFWVGHCKSSSKNEEGKEAILELVECLLRSSEVGQSFFCCSVGLPFIEVKQCDGNDGDWKHHCVRLQKHWENKEVEGQIASKKILLRTVKFF